MPHHTTTATGVFLIRYPGPYRWMYATGKRERVKLGAHASYQQPKWSPDRDRAHRWETRRAAWRWFHREAGPGDWPGVEVVRIGTPPWVPMRRESIPLESQGTLF